MDKNLIKDKLYQIIDDFNLKKITPINFFLMSLTEIHPFYNENSRAFLIESTAS